jgi:M6 family metalloprotease-like protein
MEEWMRALVWRVGLSLLAAGSIAGELAAQRPGAQAGRFEIPGMDWAPNTAWKRRVQLVSDLRWQLIRAGDWRTLNAARSAFLQAPSQSVAGAATAVTGTFYVPVIPIAYKDKDVDYPVQDFQNVLFGKPAPAGRPYTLKTYYEELSHGMITIFGRVLNPVRTDSGHAYYENGCNGIGVVTSCPDGGRRFGLMLLATLDSISNRPGADTAWSRFDNDGPDGKPNSGDDDGVVDFVTFIQPTIDGACVPSTGIWAHRFVISAWNGGSPYVTKTPRRNAQGQPIPGQFIKVDNYTIQSQVGGATACNGSQIMPPGTVTHETGHAFGLPDLYDTDRNSGTEGAGEWSIMGSGNYSKPLSPASYDPWSLNQLGWVTVDTLGATRTVTTQARALSDTVFLATAADPNEYYLFENRQAVHSDSAMFNPANASPSNPCRANCRKVPGLLIWHLDLFRIAQGLQSNTVNTGTVQGVAVEQADGLNQLRTHGGNRGDAGDPFPGSTNNTRFALATNPAARTNSGVYAGFIVDQIEQLSTGEMRFRFLRREPTVVSAGLSGAKVRVNGGLTARFEDVVPAGDQFTISADSVQETNLGRTHATFLSWSIGGPRNQTLTSGAKPDTITATFALEHRVQVVSSGTGQGTVTASIAGSLLPGIFVAQGTPVTLTATPALGSVFAGWRGDTTTTKASLTLPMAHPYDLEASFVTEVAVAVADATQEILGVAKLTDPQKQFLDQLGNRNGVYDVGDFLALLRRNGQAASPALVRALAAKRAAAKGTAQ